MKYSIAVFVIAMTATAALAQQDYEPYAEDVLQAEAQEEQVASSGCAQVALGGQEALTTSEAHALLCMAVKQLPLALGVLEYGSEDRTEVLIGALLQTGVSPKALGRVVTFQQGGKQEIVDPHHGEAFYKVWQLVFGTQFTRKILLEKDGAEVELDVDGTINWHTGYTAPTLWVRDNLADEPQLRVLDAALSPDRLLTPEEWRKLQNAEAAALLWGAVEENPLLMVEHLPENALLRLKRQMNIATTEPVDTEELTQLLRESSPEVLAEMEADVLEIPDKAAWHPRNWTGYSLSGGLQHPSGGAVPQLRAEQAESIQQRIEAALANLELIQAYHHLRGSFANDEEFLREVKRRMLENNKKPKHVVINFDDN